MQPSFDQIQDGSTSVSEVQRGFTLVEIMVVVFIFLFMFGIVLAFLVNSDRSWRVGQEKLTLQQEARRVMDTVARLLRTSSPYWVINTTDYPTDISSDNQQIDFYQPVFNTSGDISHLIKITFKPHPNNPRQLLKKVGTSEPVTIASEVENINFTWNCTCDPSCLGACDCYYRASGQCICCTSIKARIQTRREQGFMLESQVTLRNYNPTLSEEVGVEQPSGGEF